MGAELGEELDVSWVGGQEGVRGVARVGQVHLKG